MDAVRYCMLNNTTTKFPGISHIKKASCEVRPFDLLACCKLTKFSILSGSQVVLAWFKMILLRKFGDKFKDCNLKINMHLNCRIKSRPVYRSSV